MMTPEKKDRLYQIANSLRAADKIRNVYGSPSDSQENMRGDARVLPSNVDMLYQVVKIFAEYTAGDSRDTMEQALNKCTACSQAYRQLKNHVKTPSDKRLSKNRYVDALQMLSPAFNTKERAIFEKIMKLYEVFT